MWGLLKIIWGVLLIASVNSESEDGDQTESIRRFRDILATKWHEDRYESSQYQPTGLEYGEVEFLLGELFASKPEFTRNILENRHSTEAIFRSLEPSWILLLPEGTLLSSAADVGKLFGNLVSLLNGNVALLSKFTVALTPTYDTEKENFIKTVFFGVQSFSNSSIRTLSEVSAVNSPWWKRPKDLVRHFALFGMPFLSVIPSDYVSRLTPDIFKDQDIRREFLRIESKDWDSATWGEVCAWKDVLEEEFKILQNIYVAFKETSSYPKIRGLVPFLRCYSPEMITTWKASSTKISNNKNPVLRMINHYQELKLNALQVRKLSEGIAWENPSVQKQDILHLLDVGQIKKEDIDDQFLFMKNHEVQWPIVLKVLRLIKKEDEIDGGLDEYLKEFGRLFVTRLLRKYTDDRLPILNTTILNSVASPLVRHRHSRFLLGFLSEIEYSKLNPNVLFGIPSKNLSELQNQSGKTISQRFSGAKFLTCKMFPSQLSAIFQLFNKDDRSSKLFAGLENPSDVIRYLHPRSISSWHNSIPASKLPYPIALKLLEDAWKDVKTLKVEDPGKYLLSINSIKSTIARLIPGLSCSQLETASSLDIPLIASYYNDHILAQEQDFLANFPQGLRHCFKERTMDYLKLKSEIFDDGRQQPLDLLTINDVESLGGWILSAFNLTELKSISRPDVRKSVIRAIGKVPMSDLMPAHSFEDLKELAEWAASTNFLGFQTMVQLGSLTFFVPEKVLEAHTFVIRSFVSNYLSVPRKRLVCLPTKERRQWAQIIIKGFGSPRYWSSWEITQIGDLLVVLDEEELSYISPNEFRLALPQLIDTSLLHHKYKNFPSYYKPVAFSEACHSWLGSDSDYKEAVMTLMRRFLGLAQYSVIVAERGSPTILPPENLRTREALRTELYKFHSALRVKLENKDIQSPENREIFSWLKTFLEKLNREKDEAIKNILGLKFTPANATEIYLEYRKSNDSVAKKIDAIERILIGTQKILIREIKYLMNYSAISISPLYVEDTFCALVECIDPKWCELYGCHLDGTEKNLTLSCDGIITAKQAAMALKVEDLRHWTKDEIFYCLDVLGSINWPPETRKLIWNVVKEHVNADDSDQLIDLGNLLEPLVEDDSYISFTSQNMEAISLIGERGSDYESMKRLKQNIQEFLAPGISNFEMELRKASLLHLLCVLDEDYLKIAFGLDIGNATDAFDSPNSFNRLAILNLFSECENEQVRNTIAAEVLKYYGENVKNLEPSDIAAMGLFVSGFPSSVLKDLSPECFEAISPSAVRYFTVDHLNGISINQLTHMTPEALSMFEESQIPGSFSLDLHQLKRLYKIKNSLPGSVFSESSPQTDSGTDSQPNLMLVFYIYSFYRLTNVYFLT